MGVRDLAVWGLIRIRRLARPILDVILRARSRIADYSFRPERYPDSFIGKLGPAGEWVPPPGPLPRQVWCFWTGDNPLTENRSRSLRRMREVNPIRLITPETLDEVVLPHHPLHPGYEYLSLNHRSDYLRAYVMHHFGGGYSDIKYHPESWERGFARLESLPDKWMIGYPERGSADVARIPGQLGADLRIHHRRVLGCGAFICRPGSPLTAEWLHEVEQRMTEAMPALLENQGNTWGDNQGYPLEWTELMGSIFHPLALRYHDRLLADEAIRPLMKDYR